MTRTIAIDFDGTLCTNEFPDIGKPYWGVIAAALLERCAGAQLILWTCREGELLDAAVEACKEWGLTFDEINDSTPEWKEMFGSNPRKVGATEYWDDRVVAVYQGELDTSTHFMELVDEHVKAIEDRQKLILENAELTSKLRKAEDRIREEATREYTIPCELCKHLKPCVEEGCQFYEESTIEWKGKEYLVSCMDRDWGTCKALQDTPCNGCDFVNHFEWNGE